MSLVAYDSSDESEGEKTPKPILPKNVVNANVKKPRDTVKITIPSLKEFEEDETSPVEKNPKKPKLQPGSGLFSLLPPPKNATILSKSGFVPHILSSKKEQLSTTKENEENHTNIKTISTVSVVSEEQESDDEISSTKHKESLNVSSSKDFFWLNDLDGNDKNGENIFSTPVKNSTFLQNLSSQLPSPSTSGIQQLCQNKSNAHCQQYPDLSEATAFHTEKNSELGISSEQQSENYSVIESASEQLYAKEFLLKDKEFLKLRGRRREFENIDIIDVNADDQLTDRKEWLMKNLTEESTHRPSIKKHNMPTQQQKRKHQITYLAFQAKEREMDLKNQWALNSRTRRETQAKYGF